MLTLLALWTRVDFPPRSSHRKEHLLNKAQRLWDETSSWRMNNVRFWESDITRHARSRGRRVKGRRTAGYWAGLLFLNVAISSRSLLPLVYLQFAAHTELSVRKARSDLSATHIQCQMLTWLNHSRLDKSGDVAKPGELLGKYRGINDLWSTCAALMNDTSCNPRFFFFVVVNLIMLQWNPESASFRGIF